MGQRSWPYSPDWRYNPGGCWQHLVTRCVNNPEEAEWGESCVCFTGPFPEPCLLLLFSYLSSHRSPCVYASLGWFHVNCNNCTVNSWQSWHQLFDLNLRLFLPYHVASLFRIQKHRPFKMSSSCLLPPFIVYYTFLEMQIHHMEFIHEPLCIHVWAWYSLYTWNNCTIVWIREKLIPELLVK